MLVFSDARLASNFVVRDARRLLSIVPNTHLEVGEQRGCFTRENAQTRDRHAPDLELRTFAAAQLEHRTPGACVSLDDDLHLGGVREHDPRRLALQLPSVR